MKAYEDAIIATSRPWGPWYAIPADDKPFMRYCVAEIVVANFKKLGLTYPTVEAKEKVRFSEMRKILETDERFHYHFRIR